MSPASNSVEISRRARSTARGLSMARRCASSRPSVSESSSMAPRSMRSDTSALTSVPIPSAETAYISASSLTRSSGLHGVSRTLHTAAAVPESRSKSSRPAGARMMSSPILLHGMDNDRARRLNPASQSVNLGVSIVSEGVSGVEHGLSMLGEPLQVVHPVRGEDGHAVGGLHSPASELGTMQDGAVHHHLRDVGIVEAHMRPPSAEVADRKST